MKIEIIYEKGSAKVQLGINDFLEFVLKKGFMIIDYGIYGNPSDGMYGYIKYCDKQFLRDFKIKSIMNEI